MTVADLANLTGDFAARQAGLQFIWAISFGQIVTVLVFILGAVGAAIKLGAIILSMQKNQTQADVRISELADKIEQMTRDGREDRRELRGAIDNLNQSIHSLARVRYDSDIKDQLK